MIPYILQTSICLIGFYVLYIIFLKRETFFTVNRWYLMATLLASLFIPLLPSIFSDTDTPALAMTLEPVAITIQDLTTSFEKPEWYQFHWSDIILFVYIIGVCLQLTRFVKGLHDIYDLFRNGTKTQLPGFTLILLKEPHLPFSFFSTLFLYQDHQMQRKDLERIIQHERAHARQWHSLDVLLVEIVGIILWLNPVVYFYRKSLKEIHEYLADAAVLQSAPFGHYGRLLLNQRHSGLQMALTNQFFQSQLKNRIQMMTRKRSSNWASLKYLAILPILLFTIGLFSFKGNESIRDQESNAQSSLILTNQTSQFTVVPSQDTIPKKNSKAIGDKNGDIWSILPSDQFGLEEPIFVLNGVQVKRGEVNNLSPDNIATVNVLGNPSEDEIEKYGPGVKNGIIYIVTKKGKQDKINEEVFKIVEQMPRFPGCEDKSLDDESLRQCATKSLMEHIYKNIKYPEEARKARIQGRVVAQFIVTKEGSIRDIEIVRSIGHGTDEEVTRVLEMMNQMSEKWIPGRQRGKKVNVQITLPVTYRMDNSDRPTGDQHSTPQPPLPLEEELFIVVEEMPRFPGCESIEMEKKERQKCSGGKFIEYISSHLVYPKEAKVNLIEGMVVAQFVVRKDGIIDDLKILRSPGGGTSEAVLDVLNSMNDLEEKWIPGKQRGEEVDVKMTIPVKFKLTNEEAHLAKEKIDQYPKTLKLEDLKIQPNPSAGNIKVSFGVEGKEAVQLHVFDMNGKQVYSKHLPGYSQNISTSIDLTRNRSGNYLMVIVQGEQQYTTQIQKQ